MGRKESGTAAQVVSRLLVIQTGFLGDLALNLPIVKKLAKEFPVDIVVRKGFEGVPELCSWIGKIYSYDKRGSGKGIRGFLSLTSEIKSVGYSHVVSLHKSSRSALVARASGIPVRAGFYEASLPWAYNLKVNRAPANHELFRNEPLLYPFGLSLDKENLDCELRQFDKKGHVIVAPGSVWKTKKWTGFKSICEYLTNRGDNVILVGSKADAEAGEGLAGKNLIGQTSVREVCELIGSSKLVVCNDSAAGHIASLFSIPSVVVFCATSPLFGFYPTGRNVLCVGRDDLSCRPCSRHGLEHCPTGTKACIEGLKPEVVIDAIRRVEVQAEPGKLHCL